MIDSVRWQLAKPARGRKLVYQDIAILSMAPPRMDGRLRARVVLKNRGPQEADGILLRYCLAARLAPLDRKEEGVWAVPFMIEEKRVPKVGPNQFLEVPLDLSRSMDLPISLYLRRIYRSGFWPDQFRIQVMLSPHRGAVAAVKTYEVILQIQQ